MSEALSEFLRPRDRTASPDDPHAAARHQQVTEIRQRIQGLGAKSGQLGAVGLHMLRQMESGAVSIEDLSLRSPE